MTTPTGPQGPDTDVSIALHHLAAAQEALQRVRAREVGPETTLLDAYRRLQHDYHELRAQYEKDQQAWRQFKRWWKRRLTEKRERKAKQARTSSPLTSPSKRVLVSPRKSRERILEHRRQVRSMMQEHPSMFKGLGRYATDSTDRPAKTRHHDTPATTHAPDCACCHAVGTPSLTYIQYYQAVGRAATTSTTTLTSSSRHRTSDVHDPTPPDYWYVGFPSSTQEAEDEM